MPVVKHISFTCTRETNVKERKKNCCLLNVHIFMKLCSIYTYEVREIIIKKIQQFKLLWKKVGWSWVFMSHTYVKGDMEERGEIFIDISSLINHFSFLLLWIFFFVILLWLVLFCSSRLSLFILISIHQIFSFSWILSKWTSFWFIILVTKQTGFVCLKDTFRDWKERRMWEEDVKSE